MRTQLPPKAPNFWHVYCGQMAGWIKMPPGTEVGLSPGNSVLDGDPAPPIKKAQHLLCTCCARFLGGTCSPQIFCSCLLWTNGYMDQDATWYGGRPWPRPHCVRWGPSFPAPKRGPTGPTFQPMWSNGWMDQDTTWYVGRPWPRQCCVRWGSSSLYPKGHSSPPALFGPLCSGTVAHLSCCWALVDSRCRNHRFFYSVCVSAMPSVLLHCWLGVSKSTRPVKKLSDQVLAWLPVYSNVKIICIWSSWCHCHLLLH